MAATICNPLIINLANVNATQADPTVRTYTATRQLRMYDLKAYQVTDAVGGVAITVSNGADLCITLSGNPTQFSLTRLGQAATANLLDETHEVVAAGGSIVFASDDNAQTQCFLYCWTL